MKTEVKAAVVIDHRTNKMIVTIPNQPGVTFEMGEAVAKKISDHLGVEQLPFRFETDIERHSHKTLSVQVEGRIRQ
jgi:hypothetical protein